MKADNETAKTVPPFIPGLLIVSLLLFVSVLIGWRSYVRRMNVHVMMERSPDWTIWDGLEGGVPKLWEVGIVPRGGVPSATTSWKQITPLSATHITPEPTTDAADAAAAPATEPATRPPSRFHRPKFLSPTPASPAPSTPALPLPTARLQVSVLISMPSLTRSKSPRSSLSIELDGPSPSPMSPPTPHKHVDKTYHLEDDEDDEEGAPDVAFGVAVLPWRNTEGQTSAS